MAQPARRRHEEYHDYSEVVRERVSDLFTATLVYAAQYVEEELARSSRQDYIALERRYGYYDQHRIVHALIEDAAHHVGIDLHGFSIGTVIPEKVAAPERLVTFEDLMEKFSKTE